MTTQTLIRVEETIDPALRWKPREGQATSDFIKRKSSEIGLQPSDLSGVVTEAYRILGRCVDPKAGEGSGAGLVLGYVQSGKTLSFTTVTALAKDNNYGIIVLLAGVQNNLKDQSVNRLKNDLNGVFSFYHLDNPTKRRHTADVELKINQWRSPATPKSRKGLLVISVLKQYRRLRRLIELLESVNLSGVPTLIIDDEGDQASLNTYTYQNRQSGAVNESAIYAEIRALKQVVPHHTYLQYTATPQANLLVGLADVLSPTFAEIVTPGIGYVGGKDFFSSGSPLVAEIPPADIPQQNTLVVSTPTSLLQAMRIFLIGACVNTYKEERPPRSMMIHPSQLTNKHGIYFQWASDAIQNWKALLGLPEGNLARAECLADFRKAYDELCVSERIVANCELPPFEELAILLASYVLDDTRVREVNSTDVGKEIVDWGLHPYWILIGGQKLDRGYTVEGLSVTYMPRGLGTANADSMQQRARFLGYKRSYLGLCRVFLQRNAIDAFSNYVEHEENVRQSLLGFRGRPLREWKRDFILHQAMNPTRRNVIGLDVDRVVVDHWMEPKYVYRNAEAVGENRAVTAGFVDYIRRNYNEIEANAHERFKDNRRDSPRNKLIEGVKLSEVLERFLIAYRFSDPDDAVTMAAVELTLNQQLRSNPGALCDIFLIGGLEGIQNRSLEKRRIKNLFQGKFPNVNDFASLTYVGDRALRSEQRVTLHLRRINILDPVPRGDAQQDIPWCTLYIPASAARGTVIETGR